MSIRRATIDPLVTLDLVEDFVTGGTSNAIVGTLGWSFGGGSALAFVTADTFSHRGIVTRDTSAVSGTIAFTRLLVATGVHPILASDAFETTWVFRLNTNDANTKARLGLSGDFTADAPASAIYLEKQDADTSWFGTVRIASVETRTAALATVDTGWHKIKIRRINPTTVGFSFDGGAEVSIACNLALGVHPGTQLTNSAAASKTMDHDFFRLKVTGLSR